MGQTLITIFGLFLLLEHCKKNGTIQLIIDFRKCNTMLVKAEHKLPTIDNLIQFNIGFHYPTGLDFSMGHLSMPLDEPSKVIFTIIMPFGPLDCQVLPQGVNQPWISSIANQLISPVLSETMHPRFVLMRCCISVATALMITSNI